MFCVVFLLIYAAKHMDFGLLLDYINDIPCLETNNWLTANFLLTWETIKVKKLQEKYKPLDIKSESSCKSLDFVKSSLKLDSGL